MTTTPLAAVLMAGGLGTRMRSAVPKHFHPILGRRMVDWVIETGRAAGADPLVVVTSPSARDQFEGQPVTVAVQEQPLGTGDAVRSAREALSGYEGDLLILSGDTPLLMGGRAEGQVGGGLQHPMPGLDAISRREHIGDVRAHAAVDPNGAFFTGFDAGCNSQTGIGNDADCDQHQVCGTVSAAGASHQQASTWSALDAFDRDARVHRDVVSLQLVGDAIAQGLVDGR